MDVGLGEALAVVVDAFAHDPTVCRDRPAITPIVGAQ